MSSDDEWWDCIHTLGVKLDATLGFTLKLLVWPVLGGVNLGVQVAGNPIYIDQDKIHPQMPSST